MKRFPMVLALGGAAIVGCHLLSQRRGRGPIDFAAMRRRMMERMLKAMPEDSPPKLVMSVLPRLREQNDQILALLKEQSDLLRDLAAKR